MLHQVFNLAKFASTFVTLVFFEHKHNHLSLPDSVVFVAAVVVVVVPPIPTPST